MAFSTALAFLLVTGFVFALLGSLWKAFGYWRTPLPTPIPLTPGPSSRLGVAGHFLLELVLFRSLFRASKWTWFFAWIFHAGLLLLVLIHLRFFMQPAWVWIFQLQPYASVASVMFIVGLAGLLARRYLVDRIRYISAPSDYLWPVVLLVLGVSGWLMNNVWPVDLYAVTLFGQGLGVFDWKPLPLSPLLFVHISMLVVILWLFPISKLLHVPAIFFSPTITSRDTSRSGRGGKT